MQLKRLHKGFTLLEMLLVLVIMGVILSLIFSYIQQQTTRMRIDRTSMQMQTILNASLAFYVVNNKWPGSIATDLQGGGFLPAGTGFTNINPYGNPYAIVSNSSAPQLFYVYTNTSNTQDTIAIAGRLPLSYVAKSSGSPPAAVPYSTCTGASPCHYVVGAVNIPGQNLNNATAVNFAGLYNSGACVPYIQCPVDATGTTMTAEIWVVPVSVSGFNDNSTNIYPISSFTGFATGPGTPGNIPVCYDATTLGGCLGPVTASSKYWRVCLSVTTPLGRASTSTNTNLPSNVTLIAFTRCRTSTENVGSGYNVSMP